MGYPENIFSGRRLIEHCSLCLDLLYFLGYQIDEPLPWHSTISRTRQLLPEMLFEQVFTRLLSLCVETGMVAGPIQAIDSALIKANASMDSLELKVPWLHTCRRSGPSAGQTEKPFITKRPYSSKLPQPAMTSCRR